MGLLELLTKDLSLSSALMHWREPAWFRVRLRGDLVVRLLIVLGAWFAASGLLLLAFAQNVNPPGPGFGLGLGLLGAGIGYIAVLGRSGHVSGSCWIYKDKVLWQSTSAGLMAIQGNWAEWKYEAIDACQLVQANHLDQSFSVMLISSGREQTMIGIPRRVDLMKLAKQLTERGVEVTMGRQVPASYSSGLSLPVGFGAAIVGIAVLGIGLLSVGPAGGPKNQPRDVARPDVPGVELPGVPPGLDRFPGRRQRQPDNAVPNDVRQPDPVAPQRDNNAQQPPAGNPQIPNQNVPPGFAAPGAFGLRPGGIPPLGAEVRPGAAPPANPFGGPPADTPGSATDSELLGGGGGGPFRTVSPQGQPIVAVQFGLENWAGKQRVGRLVPLFERPRAAEGNTIVAPEGYVVGAIDVDAGDLVDAVRLVFMRLQEDGTLDPRDAQSSDWIGTPDETNVRTISGNGRLPIGFHGRGAAVLDAIGLTLMKGEE